ERTLLAFGYPRAREDDTRRAARAALDIAADVERRNRRAGAGRGWRVGVQQGLHTGGTVAREPVGRGRPGLRPLDGATSEPALGLAARAAIGEVLASAEAQRLVAGQIGARAFSDEQLGEVFRLALEPPLRPDGARASPLVGRDTELSHLES